MATCALLGQAVGTAAALSIKNNISPRGVYHEKIKILQQDLQDDDCWLPGMRRNIPSLTQNAELKASSGYPDLLRNGLDRPDANSENCWECGNGDWAEYRLNQVTGISRIKIIFDSNLNLDHLNVVAKYPLDMPVFSTPETLVAKFHIEIEDGSGNTVEIFREDNNYQRQFNLHCSLAATRVRLCIDAIRGKSTNKIFAFDLA
jgi:hypothetical protein